MRHTLDLPRAAVVASSLKLAGAEKQTVYMARALFEAGTDVRVFYLGEGGHYETVLRRLGIPLVQIYRQNRPMFMLARLVSAFFRFRPQIVLAPQFSDLLQAGIAGRLCRALTLGGLRSDGFYELNSNGGRARWMLRLAHGLVANSYRGSQNLISRGADPARIKVLPNVLDLAEFDARSRMPSRCALPPGRIIAAAVGSLLPCKRFDRFLKALALAQRKAPNLFGVIAGADCGAGSALLRTADELGLGPGEVSFAGECDNVPALLAQSAFLVLCSDYEGFPNVILEAMGARLPVVTTPVGDAESIVQHDLTGYVVDGDHVEAIADRMAELALSPAARKRLGMEGRRRVVLEYNYEALSTRLLAVCRDFAVQNRKHDLLKSLEGGGLVASPSGLAGARLASEPAA